MGTDQTSKLHQFLVKEIIPDEWAARGGYDPVDLHDAEALTQRFADRWSRHLWHTSQHNRCPIWLAGRMQAQAQEMRREVGLPEFGWNDSVDDREFEECSVHVDDTKPYCKGQHTHPAP